MLTSLLMSASLLAALVAPIGAADPDPRPCADYQGYGDINGDGRADAVVGDPSASVDGLDNAGTVLIEYGLAHSSRPGPTATIHQGDGVVAGAPAAGNRFGTAIAVGYVDRDYCADVLIGVPGESVAGAVNAGAVVIVYGAPGGLGLGRPSREWTAASRALPGPARAGDRLGAAVAVPTGYDSPVPRTFAFGAPGSRVDGMRGAGAVFSFQVTDNGGYLPQSGRRFDQRTVGLADQPERDDHFGAHLVVTDRDNGQPTIVIGVPSESVNSLENAGVLDEIRELGVGETPLGQRVIEDDLDVGDLAEAGDRFGSSVTFSRDYVNEGIYLVVGAPGEDVVKPNDGRIFYFDDGFNDGENLVFDQSNPLFDERPERGDRFGATVLALPYSVTTHAEYIVIGVPGEDVHHVHDAGVVHQFTPISSTFQQTISERGARTPGRPTAGDQLGRIVSAFPVTGFGDVGGGLLLGVPNDQDFPLGGVLVTRYTVTGGDPDAPAYRTRVWQPGTHGFPPEGARFGSAVGGVTTLAL